MRRIHCWDRHLGLGSGHLDVGDGPRQCRTVAEAAAVVEVAVEEEAVPVVVAVSAAAVASLASGRSTTVPAQPRSGRSCGAGRRGPVREFRRHGIRGAYRNPYSDAYFRHFRPGYRSVMIGERHITITTTTCPAGCQTVLANGITYDVCDGVYYQPYIYGGQTVYLVVPTQ